MKAEELRILYVAYSLLPVSSASCGGAEQALLLLEAQINRRGHITTVAACSGSVVCGELFSTGLTLTHPDGFEVRDRQHIAAILDFLRLERAAPRFDLIHDHSGSFWRHAAEVDLPVLATLHLPRNYYPAGAFDRLPPNLLLNLVSQSQARSFDDVRQIAGVVPNGIDAARFPLCEAKQDYLLWLGRFCHEKGAHVALEVAKQAGMRIVLAGEVYPFSCHQRYFENEVTPRLEAMRDRAQLLTGISFEQKVQLLRGARAVLISSLVDETSSLVAMEAMACGTPVICFHCGALPEVVADGVGGFVVTSENEMARATERVAQIHPRACRTRVLEHFSAARVANDYERLYQNIVSTHRLAAVAE